MRQLNLSLNLKLIGVTVIAFVVIISLITYKGYITIKNELLTHSQERMIRSTNQLKNSIAIKMLNGDHYLSRILLNHVNNGSNIKRLLIFSPQDCRVKASVKASEVGKWLSREYYDQYKSFGNGEPFFLYENGVLNIRIFESIENSYICQRCHPSGQKILGVILKQRDLSEQLARINSIVLDHVIFSILAVIFFASAFSYIVFKLVDDPLEKIMETINFIEQGDFDKQVSVKSKDIIGTLAEKFNNMTAKIKEARDEVDILHRRQMQRASELALIGEISSGIAHEIKNPLACISSALQVIDREMSDDSENKPVIQEVLSQIKRLDHVVKRILEFARPAKAPKIVFDIDKILERTFFFISNFAQQKHINVDTSFGEGVKLVSADSQAIRQVVLNICLNGLEAMQQNGTLAISTSLRVMNSKLAKGNYVEIAIRDTGSGISQENMALIFDPFFTTKEKGTGLGLAISLRIVEEHNGFVEVDSEPGAGTTFRVYLPTVEEG